jgi:hypothetical protein
VSRLALDFTKVNHRNYQLYRILQTSNIWSKIYRQRIERFGSYRTSIIFPESILGLNQKYVYTVKAVQNYEVVACYAASIPIDGFSIYDPISTESSSRLKDRNQIERFEQATVDIEFANRLCFRFTGVTDFATAALFSGKKDASKYASNAIALLIDARL